MRAKMIISVCIVALVAVYGMRVWMVNEDDKKNTAPVEHYAMNEWVDLTGSFLHSEDQAPTGYSVRITKAELLSTKEYVENYGVEKEATTTEEEKETVICLEYEIAHDGDGKVGLVLFEQKLIPDSKHYALSYDRELWWKAEPAMKDLPGTFSLRPDSTFKTHIPFTFVRNPDAFQSYKDSPRVDIASGSFELLLSNLPVRKVVDIKV